MSKISCYVSSELKKAKLMLDYELLEEWLITTQDLLSLCTPASTDLLDLQILSHLPSVSLLGAEKSKALPSSVLSIYFFLDHSGYPFYIGKSKCLNKRLGRHFSQHMIYKHFMSFPELKIIYEKNKYEKWSLIWTEFNKTFNQYLKGVFWYSFPVNTPEKIAYNLESALIKKFTPKLNNISK